ncbi:MAG: 16S rRNA (guanine(966)-N(2))-methyltransferase RsmD [Rickettsiales bacterium]
MMQIIAGSLRSRKLLPLEGRDIRPTSSRAREAIFNMLMHRQTEEGESYIIDQRIADFCCGSGAMGLEAISRGAAHAVFVDSARASLDVAQQNAQQFKVLEQCQFIAGDVTRLPAAKAPCRVIFCDPPYDLVVYGKVLGSILEGNWLEPKGLVIMEQSSKTDVMPVDGFSMLADREYGSARVVMWEKI